MPCEVEFGSAREKEDFGFLITIEPAVGVTGGLSA